MAEDVVARERHRVRHADLVRSYIEDVVNQRLVDRLDRYVAPNYRGHGFAADREALRSFMAWQASTAPGWRIEVHDVVAEGDRVAVRATASGERAERAPGDRYGAPVFRRVEWITIYRIESQRIAEAWVVSRDLDGT